MRKLRKRCRRNSPSPTPDRLPSVPHHQLLAQKIRRIESNAIKGSSRGLPTGPDAFLHVEQLGDASRIDEQTTVGGYGGRSEGLARGVAQSVRNGNGFKKKRETGLLVPKGDAMQMLTCRPARAEWLCCFFWPSTAPPLVLPPELFPPEDFPLPPGILSRVSGWEEKFGKFGKSSVDEMRQCARVSSDRRCARGGFRREGGVLM